MKSTTSVFVVFAGPVKINQLQYFTIQQVGKQVQTSNIKILCTATPETTSTM